MTVWRIIAGIVCLNIAIGLALSTRWFFPRCEWCHKRYALWSSNSAFNQVFCSYRCNYWDMRDHIASNLEVDLSEVEAYLSRRGWAHPDHFKERTS